MPNKIEIVERQNDALHKLNEIAAISHINPKETLRQALIVGKEYFGLDFAIVSHIVGEEYTIEVQSSPTETLYDGQMFALGSTYCKTTLEIDDVLAITDVTKSKYVGHPCHKEFELVSYIGAPVRVNTKVYGTINFSSPHARALKYDEIDISFMRLLARWAGSYLERQQALDALTQSEKKLRNLYELSPLGIVLNDMDGNFEDFNQSFQTICGYSEEELKNLDYWKLTPKEYEIQEALQLELLEKTGRYGPYEKEYLRKDGSRIKLSFNGVLTKDTNGHNHIWSIVEDITERKELQNKLEEQSRTDFLTGLYNRRYFTSRLKEQIFLIQRNRESKIALMMFDLDYFKRINDNFGHLAGDTIIKEFAEIIKKNLRKTDIAGRIGGEEFAIILPNTSIDNALILATRIKEEVAAQRIQYDDKYITFTVSIGMTMLTYDDLDTDMAFVRADTALYAAKEKGRNRIEKVLK